MKVLPVLPNGRLEQKITETKPAFSEAEAITEANRCLYCADAPCIKACPTGIDIPTFIRKISTGNTLGACRTILAENILGYSCARVCPVEVLCAGDCVYNAWGRPPIQIGRLQRFATHSVLAHRPMSTIFQRKAPTGKKIALVGGGPASVAAAALLAVEGHKAVIFERKEIPGGLNTLGIAPYKLLGNDALQELQWLSDLGDIELRCGVQVVASAQGDGQISAADLLAEFDAVFLGLGLGADSRLAAPGEDGPGVWGAVDLIEKIKSDPSLSLTGVNRAMVIGGGNTAIDIAHELALLGVQDVSMVYRRGRAQMSAYAHELDYGRKHGVRVIENRVVTEYLRETASHKLVAVKLAHAKDGRAIAGTEEHVSVDLVALAIGQNRATEIARAFEGVVVDSKGRVVVDSATQRTGNAKVWSGGDCVNGGKEVVNAAQEAKIAVRDMLRALSQNN
jgi:glutamate synthase (NADPH/NADH) small chain